MYKLIVNGKDFDAYQSMQDAMMAGKKAVNATKTDGRMDVFFRDAVPMRTAVKNDGKWKTY